MLEEDDGDSFLSEKDLSTHLRHCHEDFAGAMVKILYTILPRYLAEERNHPVYIASMVGSSIYITDQYQFFDPAFHSLLDDTINI